MTETIEKSSWLSRVGLLVGSSVIALTLARQLYLDSGFPSGFGYYTPAQKVAKMASADARGKTYLISGANGPGIGRETARVLYSLGARVILACRTLSKAESAKQWIIEHTSEQDSKERLLCESLELSDLNSVRALAKRIIDNEQCLDCLICNAGIMGVPDFQTSHQGFELQWATNHLGHFYLTLLLLPILQKTPDSRVITLSTSLTFHFAPKIDEWLNQMEQSSESLKECTGPMIDDYSPLRNYAFSKASNVLFAREFQRRYSDDTNFGSNNIGAVSVNPGVILTGIMRHESYLKRMLRTLVSPLVMKSVESGAACSIHCALMDHSKLDGCLWSDMSNAEYKLPDQLRNDENNDSSSSTLAERMWDISEKLIVSRGFSLTL